MEPVALLTDLFGRVPPLVRDAVADLDAERLAASPAPGVNSIGWLTWHLIRVEDHHVAEVLEQPQIWQAGPWADRFGRTADPHDTGYGHSAEEMSAVRPTGAPAIIEYHAAVADRTMGFLRSIEGDELDRVVDDRYDPPVTLGVRLVSIVTDQLQHAGQAAYVRGLLDGS